MIDVLTVTKRTGWYDIAYESLIRQKMDIHWVIVDENLVEGEATELMHTIGDNYLIVDYRNAPPKTRVSNLNASLNEGLRACYSDFVAFYEDFIVLPDDCLQKLVDEATAHASFVSTITKNPPHQEDDGRYTGIDIVRRCEPKEWEMNVAIAPLLALLQVGGFDEEYDNGWAWNNCSVAERAEMLGWKFYLDETNRPQLLEHKKETLITPNGDFHYKRMRDITDGLLPIRLDYV